MLQKGYPDPPIIIGLWLGGGAVPRGGGSLIFPKVNPNLPKRNPTTESWFRGKWLHLKGNSSWRYTHFSLNHDYGRKVSLVQVG